VVAWGGARWHEWGDGAGGKECVGKGICDLKRSRKATEEVRSSAQKVCSIALVQRRAQYGGALMRTKALDGSALNIEVHSIALMQVCGCKWWGICARA
jgi:hypothetical protein